MDKKYNVLWIDDEHEKLTGLKLQAAQNKILLNPFKSLKGGLEELTKNCQLYDAVLLDAKFFENEDDGSGSEDLSNLSRAKDAILQLPKKLSIFVLTGQAKLFEDETFEKFFPKYFRKGISEDINKLFREIKIAGEKQIDTQLRHKHQAVFEVCNEKYIGKHVAKDLLFLLNEDNHKNGDQLFNSVRKIIEDIFISFNKYKLLPDEFVQSTVSLNESSKFLSGLSEKGYTLNEESKLPKLISDNLRSVLYATQSGSHRTNNDELFEDLGPSYFFQGTLNQLLSIVVWFKKHIDSNPKKENWTREHIAEKDETSNMVEGKVINFNFQRGFAFLEPNNGSANIFIPPHLVEINQLKDGMQIAVEVEEYTDNRTQELRTKAKRVEL